MADPGLIDRFRGEYDFLSNFYVERDGVTTEHLFQSFKTLDKEAQDLIMKAPTPGQAKRLGRQVPLRSDWEEVKDDVMLMLVRDKFEDPELAEKLLATGEAELIEGNTWGDTYWGVCRGRGLNKLGRILMQVRDELHQGLHQGLT